MIKKYIENQNNFTEEEIVYICLSFEVIKNIIFKSSVLEKIKIVLSNKILYYF